MWFWLFVIVVFKWGRFVVPCYTFRMHLRYNREECIHYKDMNKSKSQTKNTFILQNKVFAWLAIATLALLAVPFVAMQFTNEVVWTWFDFVAAGGLLYGVGLAFVFVARKTRGQYTLLVVGFAIALVLIWVELAVGFFSNK